ncbi:MAG: DNA polymerase I [Pseudomonadota bacterium]|nr:DNA polymerase I [Pseudomonadota bacterium]
MATRSDRVVLIDGTWLTYRAFFAIPSNFRTAEGQPTNAVYGFATMFRKLFAGKRPAYGAVVFDPPGRTTREADFPAYKAQRPPMADLLRDQLAWIDRVVVAHGFPILRVPGLEADDVIGTLAREARDAGHEVVLVAGDKDFAQLVGEGVRLYDPMKDVTYDPELVRKKWGVPPERIVDLLALLGDTVDNIPGVAGIGEKGALQLLTTYGGLDEIYAHVDEVPTRQRAPLVEHRDLAYLSRKLATIDQHAAVDVHVPSLAIPVPDPKALDALYRALEFHSLLGDGGPTAEAVALVDGLPDLDDTVAIAPVLGPAEGGAGVLLRLALCATPGRAHLVTDPTPLREWLADPGRPKVAHDTKALAKALGRLGLTLRGCDDTMLASFLVDPTANVPHRLDQVSRAYLQQALPADPPPEIAADAVARLWPVLHARLRDAGQEAHYRAVELPLAGVLADMETTGIPVDRADLARLGTDFTTRKDEVEQRIYALAGHPFNVGSTTQLGTVLFEELKLPVVKKTKTGWSTDAEVLEALAPKHPITGLLLEQRMLAKLINTYTDVLQKAVDPRTGRVHATFQQTTGVSGRLISTDPDLQRTPVRTPEGRRIRAAFVASPGCKLVSADWSQIELRVLAHFSADPALVEAFRTGADVHRRTASEIYGVALDAVSPPQRNVGKTVNFATIYGQGATALAAILGIPRKEAQTAIERYFSTYAGVREWLDRTIAEATERGYVTTILGRRRYVPELTRLNSQDRTAGERIAANTPIQGSAADLCKLAMLRIHEQLAGMRTKMLLQVHDELVFEAPDDEVDRVVALVRAAMEHPMELAVPLVVNVGVGASWAEAH